MRLHYSSRDRQSKADATSVRATTLPEFLEEPVEVFRRDSRPRISDRTNRIRLSPFTSQHDVSAARHELQRVTYEVAHHLHDALRISPYRQVGRSLLDSKGYSFLGGGGLEHLGRLRDERCNRHVFEVQFHSAGFLADDLEQVFDQPVHPLSRPEYDAEQLIPAFPRRLGVGEEVRRHQHHVQWIAQIVSDDGEHLFPRA